VAALEDKLEARKQWDTDPCGAVTAAPVTPETAEWYESVRSHRYGVYAPWLPEVMDAGHWRGADVLEIGVGLGSDHLGFAAAGAQMHALGWVTPNAIRGRTAASISSIPSVCCTTRLAPRWQSKRCYGCCGRAARR